MAQKRLSMRKIREILRLRYAQDLSHRKIGRAVGASPGTVGDCLGRAKAAGLSWPLDESLDDGTLEGMLYPAVAQSRERAAPDCAYIYRELRKKHVTLMLLWQEYKAAHPHDGYQYTQFCEHYRRYEKRLNVTMRQTHRAGEKLFVDYSGDGIEYVDRETGEVRQAELFVAVLGASNYTYAEATATQQLGDWIGAHTRALEFIGGAPEVIVPDNAKTGVQKACHYDPELNPTYREFAEHYDLAVVPARPRKPRDKAKVESAVRVAQNWIIAALRNCRFFSVAEINDAVAQKLEQLNNKPFQKMRGCRRELFDALDRPALRPLPQRRYEFANWAQPKVNIDYHVEVARHYYSVPYQLAGKRVEVRYTASTVEILFKGKRVASHRRSFREHQHTTMPEHMPEEHRRYVEWTPSRILNWAGTIGPSSQQVVSAILKSRKYPQHGYRACLGVLRLGKRYGEERLEKACQRALTIQSTSYRSVKSILENGLDRCKVEPAKEADPVIHNNIRGQNYYK